MSIEYLGVAGWAVFDDAHVLLADPYFSRVHVADESVPLTSDLPTIARYAPPHADVILVSHSMETVRAMCDHAAWLNHGEVQKVGPVESTIAAYISSLHPGE